MEEICLCHYPLMVAAVVPFRVTFDLSKIDQETANARESRECGSE